MKEDDVCYFYSASKPYAIELYAYRTEAGLHASKNGELYEKALLLIPAARFEKMLKRLR